MWKHKKIFSTYFGILSPKKLFFLFFFLFNFFFILTKTCCLFNQNKLLVQPTPQQLQSCGGAAWPIRCQKHCWLSSFSQWTYVVFLHILLLWMHTSLSMVMQSLNLRNWAWLCSRLCPSSTQWKSDFSKFKLTKGPL